MPPNPAPTSPPIPPPAATPAPPPPTPPADASAHPSTTEDDFLLGHESPNGTPWQPKFADQGTEDLLDQMVQDHLAQARPPAANTQDPPTPRGENQDLEAQLAALLGSTAGNIPLLSTSDPPPDPSAPIDAVPANQNPDRGTGVPPVVASTEDTPLPPGTQSEASENSTDSSVSAAELDALLCSSTSMEQAVAAALAPDRSFASVEPLPNTAAAAPHPPANPEPAPIAQTPEPETPLVSKLAPVADNVVALAESPVTQNTVDAQEAKPEPPEPSVTPAPAPAALPPAAAVAAPIPHAPTPAPPAAPKPTTPRTPHRSPLHILKDIILMAAQLLDMPFAGFPRDVKQVLGICGALLVLGAAVLLVIASKH